MSTIMPRKDPDSIEPYHVVWCDMDGTNDGSANDRGELQGETISSVSWIVPTGITKTSDHTNAIVIHGVTYAANTVATIWLRYGVAGTDYLLTCRIETTGGRILDKAIVVPVRDEI